MKKIIGNILCFFAKLLSIIFSSIIDVLEWTVNGIKILGKRVLSIIFSGGCIIFFILWSFIPSYIFTICTILIFIVLIGSLLITFFKYISYVITEFLMDYGNFLISGKKGKFNSFRDFSDKYKNMKYEEQRKQAYEYEKERQRKNQQFWEETFKDFGRNAGNQQGGYYDFGGYSNTGQGGAYTNFGSDFKTKYQEACNTLGVSYDADKYTIKLAYRKKAKQYHPDLNKEENATQMFQKINEANEFLTDDNIKRYKQYNN